MKRLKEQDVIRGSGNLFRDVGHAQAQIWHAKAHLAARIIGALDDQHLSVRQAEALTGFAASDFSRIRNADLGRFSLERLIKMISALDESIEITIELKARKKPAKRARPALARP